jgi:hypothetical protein
MLGHQISAGHVMEQYGLQAIPQGKALAFLIMLVSSRVWKKETCAFSTTNLPSNGASRDH